MNSLKFSTSSFHQHAWLENAHVICIHIFQKLLLADRVVLKSSLLIYKGYAEDIVCHVF